MGLWDITAVIYGSPSAKVLAGLSEWGLNVRGLNASEEEVRMTVGFMQFRLLKRFAKKMGCQVKVLDKGGLARFFGTLHKRSGLILGAVIWTAFVLAAKDYVLSIEVMTDDERVKSDVLRLLAENGCSAGAYIPDLKKVELERMLKQRTEGVSWAGISVTDSTLIVDVYSNKEQPQMFYNRMPSDLVAVRDAVVERVEVLDGVLVTTVGSGVVRGDKLVSGTVPVTRKTVADDPELGRIIVEEQSEKYVRSLGKVYGRYTDEQTFVQPLSETSLVHTGKAVKLKKLRIFGAEIPLYMERPDGYSTLSEGYEPLGIAGSELPVGIAYEQCEPLCFSEVRYTEEQAAERVRRLKIAYEENFLSDCEIRSCEEKLEYRDGCAVLEVKYEVCGLISEEKQFFTVK